MKLSRIDLVAQNGNDGQHYKYEEVAKEILGWYYEGSSRRYGLEKVRLIKFLMEAFPDDATC